MQTEMNTQISEVKSMPKHPGLDKLKRAAKEKYRLLEKMRQDQRATIESKVVGYIGWIAAEIDYILMFQEINGEWPQNEGERESKKAYTLATRIWGTAIQLPEPPDPGGHSNYVDKLSLFHKWAINCKTQIEIEEKATQEHPTLVTKHQKPQGMDQQQEAHTEASVEIPPEYQTPPMSQKSLADRYDLSVNVIKTMMKTGSLKYIKHSRQTFTFDKRNLHHRLNN